jgi:hypothetical protein
MGTLFASKVSEQIHEMVRSIQYQKSLKPSSVPLHSLPGKPGLLIPSLSESVTRGRKIAEEKDLLLVETQNSKPNSPGTNEPCPTVSGFQREFVIKC